MAISLDKILASLVETQGVSTEKAFEDAKEVRLRWPKVQIRTEEGTVLHTNKQDWHPKQTKAMSPFLSSSPFRGQATSGYIQVAGRIPMGKSKP